MPSETSALQRRLQDIRHHIAMAERFAVGLTYEAFKEDDLRLYAVTRCLEIISEASRRLPEALKERHPSIAWRNMAGAGNIYRHQYEDVAATAVWRTLTESLPQLGAVVAQELAALPPEAV
jgi:uncharacterized protein with HEPN domain